MQIEVVRGYKSELFREDLKKVFDLTGGQQKNTVFLFNDTQVRRTPPLHLQPLCYLKCKDAS